MMASAPMAHWMWVCRVVQTPSCSVIPHRADASSRRQGLPPRLSPPFRKCGTLQPRSRSSTRPCRGVCGRLRPCAGRVPQPEKRSRPPSVRSSGAFVAGTSMRCRCPRYWLRRSNLYPDAQQRFAADCLQPALRFGFRQQLKPGVGRTRQSWFPFEEDWVSRRWYLDSNADELYERYLVPAMFGPWAADLVELAAPQPGESALDLACGSGVVARLLAQRVGPSGTVVGLDLNAGRLAVARSLPPVAGAVIQWREGDALALPFGQGAFSLVCCQQGLQ